MLKPVKETISGIPPMIIATTANSLVSARTGTASSLPLRPRDPAQRLACRQGDFSLSFCAPTPLSPLCFPLK